MQIFESKHGFYATSKEDYKVLKQLRRIYDDSLSEIARWHRWTNKRKSNRKVKAPIFNNKKQKIGYAVLGPWPEPTVCPIFFNKSAGNNGWIISRLGKNLLEMYKEAKTPKQKRNQVKPAIYATAQLLQILQQAKVYKAQKYPESNTLVQIEYLN